MTDLAPLRGTATLDTAPWSKGVDTIKADLRAIRDLTKQPQTVALTAKLTGLDKVQKDIDTTGRVLNQAFAQSGAGAKGLSDLDRQVRTLAGSVRVTRGLWQTQILTDEQAGKSAERLRDQLLRLASAENASADAVLRATQAAAQAQRTLDASRGELTKGGFAASASLGILDALSRVSGPAGSAAALIGGAITSGLLNGIKLGKPRVGKGAEDIGEEVIDALKTKLDIHSPSRVTFKLGQFTTEGLALGMKANTAQVAKAGRDVGRAAETGIGEGLRAIYGPKLASTLNTSGGAFGGVRKQAMNGAEGMKAFALSAEAVQFAAGAAMSGVIALGAGFAASVNTAMTFEHAMQAVKAVTQATDEQFAALKEQAKDLAKGSSFNLAQVAQGQEELAKMGVKVEDMLGGATRGVVLLAEATGTDLKTAAEIGARALTIFGLSGKDLPRVADVISSGANKTALDVATLGTALSQVGTEANNAGLSIEETVALLGALADRGIEGSDAGTSLKTAFERIKSGAPGVSQALDAYGVKVFDATGKQRDMITVLEDVIGAMDTMTDQQRSAFLQTVFGADATRAATIAWKAGAKGVREYVEAVSETGAAEKNAETRKDSLTGALENLSGSWDNLKETIGNGALPGLTNMVKSLDRFVTSIDDALNGGEQLSRFLKNELTPALIGVGLAYAYIRREAIATAASTAASSIVTGFQSLFTLFKSGGMAAAIKTGLTAPLAGAAAAAAPLIALAAGVGLSVAVGKLYNDIANIYDQVDKANADSTQKLLERVRALNKEGTELSRSQAKYLLAFDRLQTAQQGRVTGATIFGEQIIETDPKEIAAATAALAAAKKAMNDARAAAKAAPGKDATPLGPNFTVEQLQDQKKALDELTGSLQDRKFRLSLEGKSDLERDLAEVREEFRKLAEQASQPFKGADGKVNATPELKKTLNVLSAQQTAEERAIRAKYAKEEAKKREDEAKEAAKAAQSFAQETERVQVAAMQEGAAKKQAERDLELAGVQRQVADLIKEYAKFPALKRQIEQAGRAREVALRQQWAAEDREQEKRQAEERARAVAQAWRDAQAAQFTAEQATRDRQAAQFELRLSRQLAAVKGNAVQTAQLEARAGEERYRLARRNAEAQWKQDTTALQDNLKEALGKENLSAEERRNVWRKYYADLKALREGFIEDGTNDVKQREADIRAAEQAMQEATNTLAMRPVQVSQDRVKQLEQSRELSMSDAQILSINAKIGVERARQIGLLQDMLDGVNGVKLNAQERREVEGQILDLQHQQRLAVQEQIDLQRTLRQTALDRQTAAAEFAERTARTEADRAAALRDQLGALQGSLRELDTDIAGEGREAERNKLYAQRFGLLGRIADLQDRLDAMPMEAEQRRLGLLQARARAELALQGLGDDKAAQARQTVQFAAQDLLLANRRVASARDEWEVEAALQAQAQARLGLMQALQAQQQAARTAQAERLQDALSAQRDAADATQRQLDLQTALLDASEAYARAHLQLAGLADDAVLSAEQELGFMQDRLNLLDRQLAGELTAAQQVPLLKERVALLGQLAAQERKVTEARRARMDLAEELALAERNLQLQLAGGNASATGEAEGLKRILEARTALTRAEWEYVAARAALARTNTAADAERLRNATTTLTTAVKDHRGAVTALADTYRQQITAMDGVRSASERLNAVAYGGRGRKFDRKYELGRLDAITARRDAAQRVLAEALKSGSADLIAKAAQDLAEQEERYKAQATVLERKGVKVTRTGAKLTRELADKVDALGIQYDRETVALTERARIADQEATAARTLKDAAVGFEAGAEHLAQELDATLPRLQAALLGAAAATEADAAAQKLIEALGKPVPLKMDTAELDRLAGGIATGAAKGLQAALAGIAPPVLPGVRSGLPDDPFSILTPEAQARQRGMTQPAVHTTTNYWNITQLPGESGDALANRVIRKLEDRRRRSGGAC